MWELQSRAQEGKDKGEIESTVYGGRFQKRAKRPCEETTRARRRAQSRFQSRTGNEGFPTSRHVAERPKRRTARGVSGMLSLFPRKGKKARRSKTREGRREYEPGASGEGEGEKKE